MSTLYASFVDASAAERAAGALLDRGAIAEDLSIVANEAYHSVRSINSNAKALDAEDSAKGGLSTTTAGDAVTGATKGAAVGLGVGAAAVLASIFIPGLGLIIGGGALAMALAGGAATVVAGAAAGGVVGYLVDQGVPMEMASHYSSQFAQGGAILAIAIPTGDLPTGEIEAILMKYRATNVATYNSAKVLINDPSIVAPKVALDVSNPNIDPIAVPVAAQYAQVAEPVRMSSTTVIDASTGESRIVETQVQPTVIDPVTGVSTAAVAVDPLTGVERVVAVDPVTGLAYAPAVSSITSPVTGVTVDPVTGLPIHPVAAMPYTTPVTVVAVDPIAGTPAVINTAPATGVVIDPVSGLEVAATPADGFAGGAVAPVVAPVVVEGDEVLVERKDVNLY